MNMNDLNHAVSRMESGLDDVRAMLSEIAARLAAATA